MSQPDTERCFLFADERPTILDVVPGDPELVKGVQKTGDLRIITGRMPDSGNEAA